MTDFDVRATAIDLLATSDSANPRDLWTEAKALHEETS